MNKEKIVFDPFDIGGIEKLMEQYGDSKEPFFGENDSGEETMCEIYRDKIIHVTFQKNGWVRKNIYYKNGEKEELFDGKWKES